MKTIPYGKQNITLDDIKAVVETLQSDYLTQGPKISEFEESFAQYVGSKYAVAVTNGTAALHLAAMALGVTTGQKVITTPITFVASANCVRYCGAEVVFADINRDTYLLDISKVEALLRSSPKGTYQGIIPVDFAGMAVNMEKFRDLANKYGLWIIEDACHAPGGFFIDSQKKKQRCGNGLFSDLTVFSFHPVKHIAAGEGGMITTNNEGLYNDLLKLRTHGITRDASRFQNDIPFASGNGDTYAFPGWYMEMQELGFNYRLTDFQAALGLSQLRRADAGLARRIAIARKYDEAFQLHQGIKGQLNELKAKDSGHVYHLYVIEVDDRLGLYNYLKAENIYAQVHYIPCHLMPYYRNFGWKEGDLPNAEAYYRHCISLPMYPTLTDEEQSFVIKTVLEYVRK